MLTVIPAKLTLKSAMLNIWPPAKRRDLSFWSILSVCRFVRW